MNRNAFISLVFFFFGLLAADEGWTQQTYVVKPGDSLSSIAYNFYRDQEKWRLLLDANREKVVGDGSIIYVGTVLSIPNGSAGEGQSAASATTRVDQETGRIQIDLVTGDDFKPYTDEDLPEGGLASEIVATAFRDLGYEPVIDYINWSSALDLSQRGKFAATWPWVPTAEREENFFYSLPLAEELTFAYWNKSSPKTFDTIDDLAGHEVCRAAGYFTDFLDDLIESGQIGFHQRKDIKDCWLGLADGTFDFVVQGEYEAVAQLAELSLTDQFARSENVVATKTLHLVFPKSIGESESLRDQFDQAFQQMEQSGELNRIVEKHLKEFFASFET